MDEEAMLGESLGAAIPTNEVLLSSKKQQIYGIAPPGHRKNKYFILTVWSTSLFWLDHKIQRRFFLCFLAASNLQRKSNTGLGFLGWLLFCISWLLVVVTFPFSLCVLLKARILLPETWQNIENLYHVPSTILAYLELCDKVYHNTH